LQEAETSPAAAPKNEPEAASEQNASEVQAQPDGQASGAHFASLDPREDPTVGDDVFGEVKGKLSVVVLSSEGGLDKIAAGSLVDAMSPYLARCGVPMDAIPFTVKVRADGTVREVDFGESAKGSVADCVGSMIKAARFPSAKAPSTLGLVASAGWGRLVVTGHGSGSGSGAGSGSGKKKADSKDIDLDKKLIRRSIRSHLREVRHCYERELVIKPALKGTVVVNFQIAPDGRVTNSKASGMDQKVADCVAGVIKTVQFPPVRTGGYVNTRYPFTFLPE
jgi:hypothetical protein